MSRFPLFATAPSGRSAPLESLARRVFALLLVWDLTLLTGHVLLHLTWRFRSAPQPLRDLFAFASEDSLVTWTSIVTMFALGLACLALGSVRQQSGWKWTGALFVALSMDDGAMLHERISWLTGRADGAVYSWIVVVLPVLAVLGIAAFAQVWRGTRGARAPRRLAVLAFALWGIALALEIPEKAIRESGARWRGFSAHRYPQLLEEWCELVAPGLLLVGVLSLLAQPAHSGTMKDSSAAPRDSRRAA